MLLLNNALHNMETVYTYRQLDRYRVASWLDRSSKKPTTGDWK